MEKSSLADLPPTETCMTCHSQIWTNAALLAPVRQDAVQAPRPARRARAGLLLLDSQEGSYITGEIYGVTGGMGIA